MRDWESDIAWYLLGAFVITALVILASQVGHVAV